MKVFAKNDLFYLDNIRRAMDKKQVHYDLTSLGYKPCPRLKPFSNVSLKIQETNCVYCLKKVFPGQIPVRPNGH
jgi:hypothetical protein